MLMSFLLLRALLQVTAFHFLGSVCYKYMHIPGTSESILELSHPPKWIQMHIGYTLFSVLRVVTQKEWLKVSG